MKVLIVNAFDAYAGSQRSLANWLSVPDQDIEYDVFLFCSDGGFVTDLTSCKVTTLFKFRNILLRKVLLILFIPFFWIYLLLIFKRFNFVIGNSIPSLFLIFPLYIFNKAYIIIHEITRVPGILVKILQRFSSKKNTMVVSNIINKKFKIEGRVVFNAIARIELTDLENKQFEEKKVIFVGDFRKAKRFDFFVAIAELFKNNLQYQFVAYLSDEPQKQGELMLFNKATECGIDIKFNLKDPRIFFKDAYFLIQCTNEEEWVETFSYVAAEALCYNVPIIATGITVISELFSGSVYYNKASMPHDIYLQLLEIDEDKYQYCKRNSLTILNNYWSDIHSKRMKAILNEK
jgi:glycosyltransferase involved in cell wall biosynthesis